MKMRIAMKRLVMVILIIIKLLLIYGINSSKLAKLLISIFTACLNLEKGEFTSTYIFHQENLVLDLQMKCKALHHL